MQSIEDLPQLLFLDFPSSSGDGAAPRVERMARIATMLDARMMANFTVGQVLTAAEMNDLDERPTCRVIRYAS